MSAAISVKSLANRRIDFWKEWAILLLSLGKIRISLLITLSTATGYLLAAEEVTIQMFVPAAAVFLLACGSCALNQYQERKLDQMMDRTKGRPLPSGRLSPGVSLMISFGLLAAGSTILFYGTDPVPMALGLLAIFWYNGIYTYLKQKTAFAVVPGALIGMIPPTLGWVSGGGSLLDPRVGAVAFFFFLWQVPHFWLLLLDRGKDYEKAGFPSLTRIFTYAQLRRILFVWIFATAVTCMIIPFYGIVKSSIINAGLLAAGFWLVWKTYRILAGQSQEFAFRLNFKVINTYILVVNFLFIADHFFY